MVERAGLENRYRAYARSRVRIPPSPPLDHRAPGPRSSAARRPAKRVCRKRSVRKRSFGQKRSCRPCCGFCRVPRHSRPDRDSVPHIGEVSERPKERAWKARRWLIPASRVRIPPSPPAFDHGRRREPENTVPTSARMRFDCREVRDRGDGATGEPGQALTGAALSPQPRVQPVSDFAAVGRPRRAFPRGS